ncbi:zinc-binding dehydrogenase [Peribacillus sp. SCS-37]|uniref:zinc-binding dehydrogenase n=1 Tax=Paraperibacillus esterisolvens TaxID=3115296 RepID=UPI003905FF18
MAPAAEAVIKLFASKLISLPIARIFELREAADAHRLIENRSYTGKVLLKM